ncbi:hypothetical protein ACJMK2_005599 [Sinanodonta woodiana]|uniref:Uncharacterized protein n=1 Tax=Sinanodonta woodiana TaxID=1069815 RepID=A0ABD3VTP9_SINWO
MMEQNMKEVVHDSSVDLCNDEVPEKATLKKRRNALADIFHGVDAKAVERLFDMSGIIESVSDDDMLKMRWERISGEERLCVFVSNQRGRRNGMGDIFQDICDPRKKLSLHSKECQDKVEFNLNTPQLYFSYEDLEGLDDVKQDQQDQRRSSLPVSTIYLSMLCSSTIFILNSILFRSFRKKRRRYLLALTLNIFMIQNIFEHHRVNCCLQRIGIYLFKNLDMFSPLHWCDPSVQQREIIKHAKYDVGPVPDG